VAGVHLGEVRDSGRYSPGIALEPADVNGHIDLGPE
jgi:hypothetical protein